MDAELKRRANWVSLVLVVALCIGCIALVGGIGELVHRRDQRRREEIRESLRVYLRECTRVMYVVANAESPPLNDWPANARADLLSRPFVKEALSNYEFWVCPDLGQWREQVPGDSQRHDCVLIVARRLRTPEEGGVFALMGDDSLNALGSIELAQSLAPWIANAIYVPAPNTSSPNVPLNTNQKTPNGGP